MRASRGRSVQKQITDCTDTKKEITIVTNTPWQRRHDVDDDEAKHSYADKIIRIRNISDRLADITCRRRRIDRKTLSWLQSQLQELADGVYDETLAQMTVANIDVDPLQAALLKAFYETYSDGTPVWTRAEGTGAAGDPGPADFYSRSIQRRAGGLRGPLPPGCEVSVADPPHRRQRTETPTSFASLQEILLRRANEFHEGVALSATNHMSEKKNRSPSGFSPTVVRSRPENGHSGVRAVRQEQR